ncbi:MAG: ATP-grasp domain-containing protein [Acidobacteriota bacterium]|nr:ATP-grasp domain-containing protein [Acidobacteriota bacterium]
MPHFTKGLAAAGVRIFGLGDGPQAGLPQSVQRLMKGYLQVPSLWDEKAVIQAVHRWKGMATIHRVECLWEPGMVLAARLREALGVPGLTVAETIPYRDKEQMKRRLDQHNIRTPKHFLAATVAECWDAAAEIGFPLIIKPIAGAGSADTYRVNDRDELRAVLPRLGHVPQVSVEEFVDGEEFTFDTICADGKILYYNIAWYRPRPLVARGHEWISPQVIALRNVDEPDLAEGVKMGYAVIKALKFQSGFTHMEWYRKADGEVVFGEIGARPPGAHQVDQMNYACDIDVFKQWANAVCHSKFEGAAQRRYNVATIYKRAQGRGTIYKTTGEELLEKYGEHIVWNNLLPLGSRRRNWRHTLVSDGFIMLRHPDLKTTLAMADDIGTNFQMHAR